MYAPRTRSSATTGTATTSQPAALSNAGGDGNGNGSGGGGGLSTGGTTALAVVLPVAFVAALVGLGIFLWRKRRQRTEAQEQRRKEVEDYGYNPNQDPSMPPAAGAGAGAPEMTQDSSSGYRGWGAAAASNRKASTTLSGGHTQGQLSESGNSYGHSPGSPGYPGGSDGHSGDALVNQRETIGSADDLGALGAAPVASSNPGIKRGPSNASSAYSNGARSEGSDEPMPSMPSGGIGQAYDYNPTNSYGYSQHGPYGDGTYGGGQDNGMPVVRDVSARRNTRIQQGGGYGQGTSGIAQNF